MTPDLPLPIARTDIETSFSKTVTFNGESIQFNGRLLDLHRPNVSSFSLIRFLRDDDPVLPSGDAHYCGIGMDCAVGGYYFCIYDNGLDIDFFMAGIDGPYAGRLAFGRDAIVPDVQLSIHDVDPKINYTVKTWSNANGFWYNSPNPSADAFIIERNDGGFQHWLCFHQGNGNNDLRIGMAKDTYSVGIFAGDGSTPTTASAPGTPILSLGPKSVTISVPLVCPEITALQQRVSDLESHISKLSQQIQNMMKQPSYGSTAE